MMQKLVDPYQKLRNSLRQPFHVAILAPPKSASTFVYQVLRHLLNAEGRLAASQIDLAPAGVTGQAPKWCVTRDHVLPNSPTLSFLELSSTRTVLLTRDLADSVVSLSEEWQKQWSNGHNPVHKTGYSHQFLGHVPKSLVQKFMTASQAVRYDLVIELAIPWYCEFIVGWRELQRSHPSWVMLDYDELISDPVGAIDALLCKLSAPIDRRHIELAILELSKSSDVINFNKGHRGRGRELLTSLQRQRIKQIWLAFASPVLHAGDDAIVQIEDQNAIADLTFAA
jgi:hypothetical protein